MGKTDHVIMAEAAYVKYRKIQARIGAFEESVSRMFPDNDRAASAYIETSDETEVWVYKALCKLRAIQEQIIATETAMASLYT